MLYKELPVAFPWYEKIEQQNRYAENTQAVCDFQLITPANALLPFQFYRVPTGVLPSKWEIYEVNSGVKVADISGQIAANVDRKVLEGREYYTYYGGLITGLGLPFGYYYSRFLWPDNTLYYSEMFHVPENWFNVQDDDDINYLKFTWYNENDIRPIYYNDKGVDGLPKFKNVLYVDSFITASELEISEDGVRDGNDETIPTFQKGIVNYRITLPVPDYAKKALTLMQMHDFAGLTTKKGVRAGKMEGLKISGALEASGGLSIVDIIFQDIVLVKKGCGENMV